MRDQKIQEERTTEELIGNYHFKYAFKSSKML